METIALGNVDTYVPVESRLKPSPGKRLFTVVQEPFGVTVNIQDPDTCEMHTSIYVESQENGVAVYVFPLDNDEPASKTFTPTDGRGRVSVKNYVLNNYRDTVLNTGGPHRS